MTNIQFLGNIYGFGQSFAGAVFDTNGLCPTINTCGGGNREPLILSETDKLMLVGQMDNTIDNTLESANRVYSPEGISPTINTCGGGGLEPKVLGGFGEKKSNGGTQWYQQDRVYDSDHIAMCHPANIPDGSYKYLVKEYVYDEQNQYIRQDGCVGTLTTDGSSPKHNSRIIEKNLEKYFIRKLTPKECWRLMGFTDEDFERAAQVNSNSQLYKQAGNSIVVDVLCAIFGEMY